MAEVSRTYYAEKQLSDAGPEPYEKIPEVLLIENMMNSLIKEYSGFPIQKNVCWKPAYSVRRGMS